MRLQGARFRTRRQRELTIPEKRGKWQTSGGSRRHGPPVSCGSTTSRDIRAVRPVAWYKHRVGGSRAPRGSRPLARGGAEAPSRGAIYPPRTPPREGSHGGRRHSRPPHITNAPLGPARPWRYLHAGQAPGFARGAATETSGSAPVPASRGGARGRFIELPRTGCGGFSPFRAASGDLHRRAVAQSVFIRESPMRLPGPRGSRAFRRRRATTSSPGSPPIATRAEGRRAVRFLGRGGPRPRKYFGRIRTGAAPGIASTGHLLAEEGLGSHRVLRKFLRMRVAPRSEDRRLLGPATCRGVIARLDRLPADRRGHERDLGPRTALPSAGGQEASSRRERGRDPRNDSPPLRGRDQHDGLLLLVGGPRRRLRPRRERARGAPRGRPGRRKARLRRRGAVPARERMGALHAAEGVGRRARRRANRRRLSRRLPLALPRLPRLRRHRLGVSRRVHRPVALGIGGPSVSLSCHQRRENTRRCARWRSCNRAAW